MRERLERWQWPNREASRFVDAGGVHWHVQVSGAGPALLLLHGTGAASHTWRDVAPRLADRCTVVAPDLPGQGLSRIADGRDGGDRAPSPYAIDAMADALAALLQALAIRPVGVVGHSAGAALGAMLIASRPAALAARPGLVAINGALLPLRGLSGPVLLPMAKLLSASPLTARWFAARAADPAAVARLVRSTGSVIDARGMTHYGQLLADPAHVAGTLKMLANWSLDALQPRLATLAADLLLVTGAKDRTVPPIYARRVARALPAARAVVLPGLGHLAHEEDPAGFAALADAHLRKAEREQRREPDPGGPVRDAEGDNSA